MEFLRKLFVQTQQHLKGLTRSQRLAIGSCAGLIAVALLWLMSWAGRAEFVPLFDQSLNAEEMASIQKQLDDDGVEYRLSGDRLLVPADSRPRLQARLAQTEALPHDISIGYRNLFEDSSPWHSRDDQDWRRNVALSNELSKVLRHFPGLRDARVFLDKSIRRTIGSAPVTPTASIQVTPAPGFELDKNSVRALAGFVSRAVAGLSIHDVQVTDFSNRRTYSVPRPEDDVASDDLDVRRQKENYFAEQIRDLLSDIPGIRVAVRAELDAKATRVSETKHGRPAVTSDRSRTLETSEGQPAAEPGVVPNTTSPNAPVAVGGTRTEETETETKYDATQDVTTTTFDMHRHTLMSMSASVFVPRSFLAGIYKQANAGKEPTDDELEAAATTQKTIAKIETAVKTILPAADTDKSQVAVAWFYDSATLALADTVQAGASDDMMTYVRTYGGRAGLGALAVMSLLMMLMMVRKVGNGPVLPGEEPPPSLAGLWRGRKDKQGQNVQNLDTLDAPVGEAEITESLLVGKEVDERTMRAQKLVEQVDQMVREDPQAAVSVLQRWIEQDQQ